MNKKQNWLIYSAIINIVGVVLSLFLAISKGNGGDGIGYVFVGIATTGLFTILSIIFGFFISGKRMFNSGDKIFLLFILITICLCEMLLVKILEL